MNQELKLVMLKTLIQITREARWEESEDVVHHWKSDGDYKNWRSYLTQSAPNTDQVPIISKKSVLLNETKTVENKTNGLAINVREDVVQAQHSDGCVNECLPHYFLDNQVSEIQLKSEHGVLFNDKVE